MYADSLKKLAAEASPKTLEGLLRSYGDNTFKDDDGYESGKGVDYILAGVKSNRKNRDVKIELVAAYVAQTGVFAKGPEVSEDFEQEIRSLVKDLKERVAEVEDENFTLRSQVSELRGETGYDLSDDVEALRSRVRELEGRVEDLQEENTRLRADATASVQQLQEDVSGLEGAVKSGALELEETRQTVSRQASRLSLVEQWKTAQGSTPAAPAKAEKKAAAKAEEAAPEEAAPAAEAPASKQPSTSERIRRLGQGHKKQP